jgi:hypothetical protein
MPYIKPKDRERFDEWFKSLPMIQSPGELNYVFTMLCRFYIQGPTYTNINDAIGALECAKQELYRRLAAPYEDKKIKENGDVY